MKHLEETVNYFYLGTKTHYFDDFCLYFTLTLRHA